MPLNTSLPDFSQRAIAALAVGQIVSTDRGFARLLGFDNVGNYASADVQRPYAVTVNATHATTRHATPALAIAMLRSL